jgi:hypothetical protein
LGLCMIRGVKKLKPTSICDPIQETRQLSQVMTLQESSLNVKTDLKKI